MSELYRPGVKGCTDGNCMLVKNTGMVTNGGCQCESDIRRVPHGFDAIRTIHFLRDQLRDADAELERLRADAERFDDWIEELREAINGPAYAERLGDASRILAAIDEARKG